MQEEQLENMKLLTGEPGNLMYWGESGQAVPQAEKNVLLPGENNV